MIRQSDCDGAALVNSRWNLVLRILVFNLNEHRRFARKTEVDRGVP